MAVTRDRDFTTPAWTVPAANESFLRRLGRRAVTTPLAALLVTTLSVAFLPLLALALLVDAVKGRLGLTRTLLFVVGTAWIQTVGWVLMVLGTACGLAPAPWRLRWAAPLTTRVSAWQQGWAARALGFRMVSEAKFPDPRDRAMIVLVRHASAADGFLPMWLLGTAWSSRPVMKREMANNPWIDWAAHSYPNRFLVRNAGRGTSEAAHLVTLVSDLCVGDAVLLWPEGTYFSPAKRDLAVQRLTEGGHHDEAAYAASLRATLTPFRSGPLALLAANPGADLVVLGHHGMDDASHAGAFFRAAFVGRDLRVRTWHLPWEDVVASGDHGVTWLRGVWREVDRFAAEGSPDPGAFPDS